MRKRRVFFAPEARDNLVELYEWIAAAADPDIALPYIERIEDYRLTLETASERGQLREDIRPGLRVASFRRRLTTALSVSGDRATILRVFNGGRNLEREI
ncbi:type II toxin-antitoxin system RelE/ParE family toxin [Stappia sp. GBMRC 2046]|uniref:Type II toxin-antitoxin system RelE/ParE family toxin n=1 Tax=Stappia sediminis TaxID=2692190 RepID=A0A7X3S8D6_9HYPH|nr:type II toxin-antitoxin system RelE/ParE family toxin [Stappia sediminis]MXN65717.1 type II toxin-antitoxin system RelE/ParE family toxin [Stappia sediminis]